MKCSKCAYVWLNFIARFPKTKVDAVFHTNLFNDPALLQYWRELMGLTEHNAWECVGEIHETRLAMKMCVEKGLEGKALDIFKENVLNKLDIDWDGLVAKYDRVYDTDHNIPPHIFKRIQPFL